MSEAPIFIPVAGCISLMRCWEVHDIARHRLQALGDAHGPLVEITGMGNRDGALLMSLDVARQLYEALPAILEASVAPLTRDKAAEITTRGFRPIDEIVED